MNDEDPFFIGSGLYSNVVQGALFVLFAALCLFFLFWVFKKQSDQALNSSNPNDSNWGTPFIHALIAVTVLFVFFGAILF